MNPALLAACGGAIAGIGVLLAVRTVLQPPPPRLQPALQRLLANPDDGLDRALQVTGPNQPGGGATGILTRTAAWLARQGVIPVRLAPADLLICGTTTDAVVTRQLTLGIFGLLLPAVLASVLPLLNITLPWTLPALLCLLSGGLFFLVPAYELRDRAKTARGEFRDALSAYLDLVALDRAAGGGPAHALEHAASIGDGWVFRRLRDTLTAARYAGIPPWTALAHLGLTLDIPELADLADIVTGAGTNGAAIFDTLTVKAAALRRHTLTDLKATANARSDAMSLPTAVLLLGFLLLLTYPAVAALLPSSP